MAGIENALEHNTLIRAIKMYSDGIRPEEGTKNNWVVPSQGKKSEPYEVSFDEEHLSLIGVEANQWSCNCYHYQRGNYPCKHILLVKLCNKMKELRLSPAKVSRADEPLKGETGNKPNPLANGKTEVKHNGLE